MAEECRIDVNILKIEHVHVLEGRCNLKVYFHFHITTVWFCCVNSGCGKVAVEWGGGVAEGHLGHALHHLVHGLGAACVCCVRRHHYDNCTSNTQLCPTQRKFMQ